MLRTTKAKFTGDNAGESKAVEKSGLGNNKRRALGDITNATAADEGKEANKKVAIVPSMSYRSNEVDMSDDTSNAMVDDRSYMQRPSDDIDSRDAGNPLLVSTYVNDMYEHFSAMEKQYVVNSNYMTSQPYINDRMRCILVDWLVNYTTIT
jgi:hypothetical protein